jgi:hypothetical protein
MSSQQFINCDSYSIEANQVKIKSTTPLQIDELNLTGDLSVGGDLMVDGNLTVTNIAAQDLAVRDIACRNITSSFIISDYVNPQVSFGFPTKPSRVSPNLVVNDTGDTIYNNHVGVTGAINAVLLIANVFRLGGGVFYDFRMIGSATIPVTTTASSFTTDVLLPEEYRVQNIDDPTTNILAGALINNVITLIMMTVNADGSVTFSIPGGTFTAGDTFYLLETSGIFFTLLL